VIFGDDQSVGGRALAGDVEVDNLSLIVLHSVDLPGLYIHTHTERVSGIERVESDGWIEKMVEILLALVSLLSLSELPYNACQFSKLP
jgi:hypothetical protein